MKQETDELTPAEQEYRAEPNRMSSSRTVLAEIDITGIEKFKIPFFLFKNICSVKSTIF